MKKMVLIIVIGFLCSCSSGNLEDIKIKAPELWANQGFKVVAYEGYKWGYFGFGTNYGGAEVWYRLEKIPNNGITYSGFIQKWGDEYHMYGPKAIEAISPK